VFTRLYGIVLAHKQNLGPSNSQILNYLDVMVVEHVAYYNNTKLFNSPIKCMILAHEIHYELCIELVFIYVWGTW